MQDEFRSLTRRQVAWRVAPAVVVFLMLLLGPQDDGAEAQAPLAQGAVR